MVEQDERRLNLALAIKYPCRVATTGVVMLSGLQTVDGVVLASGTRVVVRAQADARDNGIYLVRAGAWERAPDFSGAFDVAQGTFVRVWDGATLAGWQEVVTVAPMVGETTIDWRSWTWGEALSPSATLSAGGASVAMLGASTFRADFSATGAATAIVEVLPALPFFSAGTSSTVMAGASLASAVFLAAGVGTAVTSAQVGDLVYVFGGVGVAQNVERYDLTFATVSQASAITYPGSDSGYSGCGDQTAARITGSENYTTGSIKYTYATEASAAGTTMGVALTSRAGAQSATTGYFFCGSDNVDVDYVATERIAFSTETRTGGTNLSTARFLAAAVHNSTRAIVGAGARHGTSALASTEKYTFASDTVSSGTTLTTTRDSHYGASCTTFGIFGGGTPAPLSTQKYTFSTDAVTTTTTLLAQTLAAASGNNTLALACGGLDTGVPDTTVETYTFATDAVVAGTSLLAGRWIFPATCTKPGGL